MNFIEKLKKIKGFTLIELLAIIVILAVVAVITVPLILNIIDNSKKGAAVSSAYGFKDAVDKQYLVSSLSDEDTVLNGEYTVSNGTLSGNGLTNEIIPVSGVEPTSGTLTYLNNKLQSGCLVISGYEVRYANDKFTSNGTGNCGTVDPEPTYYAITYNANGGTASKQSDSILAGSSLGTLPTVSRDNYIFVGWFDASSNGTKISSSTVPSTDTTYYAYWIQLQTRGNLKYADMDSSSSISSGDYVKIGDDGFWVIAAPSSSKVKLITEYSLNSSSRQASDFNFVEPSYASSAYWYDWDNSTIYSTYTRDSYNQAYVYTKDSQNNVYSYINLYKTYLDGLNLTTILDARLMSYEEAAGTGCTRNGNCPAYMYRYSTHYGVQESYFLGSARTYDNGIDDYEELWYVNTSGSIHTATNSSRLVIRPLIEINESALS